ncbi:MAG: hypothetical protein PHF33_09035 [Candidatus Delongbacteria bacterium]|nr:hypothetical protein [Candidatus Delongbacteria bacterium]
MFKKMIKVLGLSLLAVSLFTACSDDDDPASPTNYENIFVHWMNDSAVVSFEGKPTTDLNGETVIGLQNFITDANVPQDADSTFFTAVDEFEARQLYSYHIIGDDGFSASGVKGYPNNTWSELGYGYINSVSRDVSFPDVVEDNFDIAGAYNVKATRHIKINRKISVVCNDTINYFYDLKDMPTVIIPNHDGIDEEAIELTSFLEKAADDSLQIDVINDANLPNMMFNIRSADDWGPSTELTWTQLQTGYWLTKSLKTIFTDAALTGGAYKVKYLEKITAHE